MPQIEDEHGALDTDKKAARLQALRDLSEALRSGEFLTHRSSAQPGEATCPTT